MKAFDKIIGYDTIKNELIQICDMIKNREIYAKMGAKLPSGILLYGNPGLGKSLMAKCFIEECGIETFTVRKNKSENFVEHIGDVFKQAKKKAPAIVFLDDMDKFANEDPRHKDAEEYVAVQSGIDEVKESDVFVFATVNDFDKLPDSLTRAGRFDRHIEVCAPSAADCLEIIKYYLSGKRVDENVNFDDISKMISYSSCAELETIMNEAAIIAARKRKDKIEMSDIVNAVLKMEYDAPDELIKVSDGELEKIAYHEAGHLVMSEVLCPGSVGLASLRKKGRNAVGGFVRRCRELPDEESHILVSLAGKAAYELNFGGCADGCQSDIRRAYLCLSDRVKRNGEFGFAMVDVDEGTFCDPSNSYLSRSEAVIQAELERYLYKAKEIILNKKDYIKRTVDALLEKETLLASDISKIWEICP